MKNPLRYLSIASVGAVAAIGFSSCAYDPYYSGGSVGGSYSSGGYGDGYGYGGSSFSTSVFVGTGDSRWGYDPSCYSYYDYRSRRYYDPYLNGYYPVGYRPSYVYGASHPYGWNPGDRYLSPPRNFSNREITNYRDRAERYRESGYSRGQVQRQQPRQESRGGYESQHRQQSPSFFGGGGGRQLQQSREEAPRFNRQNSGQEALRSNQSISRFQQQPSRPQFTQEAIRQESVRQQSNARQASRPEASSNLRQQAERAVSGGNRGSNNGGGNDSGGRQRQQQQRGGGDGPSARGE